MISVESMDICFYVSFRWNLPCFHTILFCVCFFYLFSYSYKRQERVGVRRKWRKRKRKWNRRRTTGRSFSKALASPSSKRATLSSKKALFLFHCLFLFFSFNPFLKFFSWIYVYICVTSLPLYYFFFICSVALFY